MSTNNTLQTSINWAQAYIGYISPVVGTNSEPALSSANMVMQAILSSPFTHPWNRNKYPFTITSANQDYVFNIPDFGFIETATFQPIGGGVVLPFQTKNVTALGESTDSQQPTTLAVQLNDGNGNITFRNQGLPDQSYNVIVTYQKAPPVMTSTSSKWAPIPDHYQHIYNRGFLAWLYDALKDPRAQAEKMGFAASLLSHQEGLSVSEKNIFMSQYLNSTEMLQASQLMIQQGTAARGQ